MNFEVFITRLFKSAKCSSGSHVFKSVFYILEMLYPRLCIGNTGGSCPVVLHSSKEILVDPVQLSFTAARHSVLVRSLAPDTTLTSFLAECESKTRQSRKTAENFRTSRILMMLEYCLLSEVRLYSMEPGRMGIRWLRQGSG